MSDTSSAKILSDKEAGHAFVSELDQSDGDDDQTQGIPYTLPRADQSEQRLPNELMSLIYSFAAEHVHQESRPAYLLPCLLASQEQYELVADTVFDHYDGPMFAVRIGNHVDIRLIPDIPTDLPGGKIRLDIFRRAVRSLDTGQEDIAMHDHEHPAFDLLARQLPRLDIICWRWFNDPLPEADADVWTVRKKAGERWSELELRIGDPSLFIWSGGSTYLSSLTSMLALSLSSLNLSTVAEEDFDDDLGAVVSDLSRHCSQLRSLDLYGLSSGVRIDRYRGLFSTSLVSVCLSTMNLKDLGTILAWNLPNLRDVRLTFTFWSAKPDETPQILMAPAVNVRRTSSNLSTLSFEFANYNGSFKGPHPQSVALWLSGLLNLDCRLVVKLGLNYIGYTYKSERRWFEELQARYTQEQEREAERERQPR